MGTNLTPIHALPWPDGTERVMDGDNAIGALATAVDRELEELAKTPGLIVQGPTVLSQGSAQAILLPLDTVLVGNPAWFDNANDRVTPTGVADGMFAIDLFATLTNVAAAQTGISIQIHTGAPGATAMIAANSITGNGAVVAYASVSTVARIAPGWCIEARCNNPVADVGDWRVMRLCVRRISDIFPASLLLAE